MDAGAFSQQFRAMADHGPVMLNGTPPDAAHEPAAPRQLADYNWGHRKDG